MFAAGVRQTGQAWLLTLRGELDFNSAMQPRKAADRVAAEPSRPRLTVIGCAGLGFCDPLAVDGGGVPAPSPADVSAWPPRTCWLL